MADASHWRRTRAPGPATAESGASPGGTSSGRVTLLVSGAEARPSASLATTAISTVEPGVRPDAAAWVAGAVTVATLAPSTLRS